MIRYGGWIYKANKEEFLQDVVDADIQIKQSLSTPASVFFIVYFIDRKDELYFRLKYPMLKKEIDDATISTIPA